MNCFFVRFFLGDKGDRIGIENARSGNLSCGSFNMK